MVHSLFVACRSPSESKASFRSHLRYLSEVLRLATQSQDLTSYCDLFSSFARDTH